jgi:hypothetical protein
MKRDPIEIVNVCYHSAVTAVSFKFEGRLMRTSIFFNEYTQQIETARVMVMTDAAKDLRRLPRKGPMETRAQAALVAEVRRLGVKVPVVARSES